MAFPLSLHTLPRGPLERIMKFAGARATHAVGGLSSDLRTADMSEDVWRHFYEEL